MVAHDIVHEREGDAWAMRVSHYPKLGLDPNWIFGELGQLGLTARYDPAPPAECCGSLR